MNLLNFHIEPSDEESPDAAARKDPIQKAMGDFGRWHLFVCVVIFLLKFPVAWHQVSSALGEVDVIISNDIPPHVSCAVQMSIIFIAPPAQFECSNETMKRCDAECPAHEFDRSIFSETIITKWDLVCDNAQWANVSQMIFMFGILLGNVLFGTVADKYVMIVSLACV